MFFRLYLNKFFFFLYKFFKMYNNILKTQIIFSKSMIISILIITLIIFVKLFIICHFLNKKKLPKGLNNEKLD